MCNKPAQRLPNIRFDTRRHLSFWYLGGASKIPRSHHVRKFAPIFCGLLGAIFRPHENDWFRRKSGVGTREWQVFVTRSCSEPLELLGERQLLIAGIFRLLFAHHMDQLDATYDHPGTISGLEAEHWTHAAFDGAVILLDAVI